MGALSLGTALIIFFSTSFAREFEAEREKRPTYKKHLLKGLVILIAILAVATILNEIANLPSPTAR